MDIGSHKRVVVPKPPTAVGNASYVEVSKFRFCAEVNEHPSNATLRKMLQDSTAERRTGAALAAQRQPLIEGEAEMLRGSHGGDEHTSPKPRQALPPIGSADTLSTSLATDAMEASHRSAAATTIASHNDDPQLMPTALVPMHSGPQPPPRHRSGGACVALRVPPRRLGPQATAAETGGGHVRRTMDLTTQTSLATSSMSPMHSPPARQAWLRGRSGALERMDDVASEQSRSISPGADPHNQTLMNTSLSQVMIAGPPPGLPSAPPSPRNHVVAMSTTPRAGSPPSGTAQSPGSASLPDGFSGSVLMSRAKFANMVARSTAELGATATQELYGGDVAARMEAELAALEHAKIRVATPRAQPITAQVGRGFYGCRSMMVAPQLHGTTVEPGKSAADVGLFATAAGGALKARYQGARQKRKQQQQAGQQKVKKSREAQLKDEADEFRRETRAKLNAVVVRSLHSLAMVEEAKVFQEVDHSLPSRCTYPHMHALSAVRDVPTDPEEAALVIRQLGEAEKVDDHAPRWLRWGRALDRPLPPIDAVDLTGTRSGLLPKSNPVLANLPRRRSRRRSSVSGVAAIRRKSVPMASASGSPTTMPVRRASVSYDPAGPLGISGADDGTSSPLSPFSARRSSFGTVAGSPAPSEAKDTPFSHTGVDVEGEQVVAMPPPAMAARKSITESTRRISQFASSAHTARQPVPPQHASERPLVPVGRRVSVDIVASGLVDPTSIAQAQTAQDNEAATRFRRGAAKVDAATDGSLTVAQRRIALIRRQAAVENASRAETEANERLRARGGALFRDDELELAVIEQLQAEADRYITTYQAKSVQTQIATQRAVQNDSHTQRFEKGLAARRLMRNRKQVDQEDREELDWGQWRRAATKALSIGLNEVTTQAVASRMQVQWITTRSHAAKRQGRPGPSPPLQDAPRPPGEEDGESSDADEQHAAATAAAANAAHSLPCYSARTLLADPAATAAAVTEGAGPERGGSKHSSPRGEL